MKKLFDSTTVNRGEARVDELFESVVRLISGKDRREDEGLEEEEMPLKRKQGC
jgi:hypothetical protein